MKRGDSLSRSWSPRAACGLFVSSVLGNAAIGCGSKADPGTTDDTTGSTSTTSSGSSTSTTDPGAVTTDVPTSSSSSSSTVPMSTSTDIPDCANFLWHCFEIPRGHCDVFGQDCPDGEKCEAVITDGGGAWNSAKCVPVTGTDLPGDPCTAESVADGLDSCVKGAMCWGVDDMGMGTCVALCTGTPDAPLCPNNGACTIANGGFLNLCLPTCDPLAQDCPKPTDACMPFNDSFLCALNDAGDKGKANDPCEFVNVCQPGLFCAVPEFVGAGCPPGSQGCCTPFCEFPGGACPNPDQSCVQWFDPANIPPEPDNAASIGACGVP